MKTIKQCPICKKIDFKEHINSIDYSVSKEEFTIIKCINCDFHFTNPRPTDSELGKYYISDHYISHNNTSKNLFEKTYKAPKPIKGIAISAIIYKLLYFIKGLPPFNIEGYNYLFLIFAN